MTTPNEQFKKDLAANEAASDKLDAELNKPTVTPTPVTEKEKELAKGTVVPLTADPTVAKPPVGALVNTPEVLSATVKPSSANAPAPNRPLPPAAAASVAKPTEPVKPPDMKEKAMASIEPKPVKPTASVSKEVLFTDLPVNETPKL